MELDNKAETATASSQQSVTHMVPIRENQPPPQRLNHGPAESGVSSDDSFTSAREDLTSRNVSKEQLREEQESDNAAVPDEQMEVEQQIDNAPAPQPRTKNADADPESIDQDQALDDEETSDVSSPGKPLQRKSSFTFTALPPRDPLTAKKSVGARNSQIEGRNSTLARSFGGKSFGVTQKEDNDDEYVENKSEESKAHSKTSTQILHERINLLGKTKEPRPTKSLHQSVAGGQAAYPQLPAAEPSKTDAPTDDSEDDWIAPTKPPQPKNEEAGQQERKAKEPSPERPPMHQKSISTTQMPSPSRPEMSAASRHQNAFSVSNPNLAESTTPAGSPMSKKHNDGPLSASKNKLYSVLKSAKSIFASSASASAAAKLEAHNNSPSRAAKRDISDESKTAAVFNMPGALYSERQLPQSPGRPISIISAVSTSPSRKTRSSSESEKKREKELKAQQKAADDLEKAREKERQKAAKQQEEKLKAEQAEAAKKEREELPQRAPQSERPISAGSDKSKESEMPPPPPPKSMLPAGKLRAIGRIGKPTREQPHPSKPAPVSIKVGLQSQRLHQVPSSSSLSKSQHESSAPPPPSKPTGVRPGSAQGRVASSTVPNNARKALDAAARKKEADEKAAQKKAEQKRELDRKRAAKAEEERRAEEERKAAEQQRLQEVKLAAARQAEKQQAEAKRREQAAPRTATTARGSTESQGSS